jgi:hypothetical protein
MVLTAKRYGSAILFSHKERLAGLNGVLVVAIIIGNLYFQTFCIPTNWAIVMIEICFVNMIISPILSIKANSKGALVVGF